MTALLQMQGICKAYPGVLANNAIDLSVEAGEIHGVIGENGAGKSTLMKLIYGISEPDSGEIRWQGKPVRMSSAAAARELGIGMVFQHFSLFEPLSVVENIALAMPGKLDDLQQRIVEAGEAFGLPVDPSSLVHSLSVGERQRVEIIRCVLQQPRLLIMDEPTSVLPPQGVEALFDTLRRLRDKGCSILYISHKLEEVRTLCDTATVLRQGRVVSRLDPRQSSLSEMASHMVGHAITSPVRHARAVKATALLSVDVHSIVPDDPFGTTLTSLSLQVRAGEVVGIAGVSGNGQRELLRIVSGEDRLLPPDRGEVVLSGHTVNRLGPAARRQRGLNVVPEERLGRGAVPAVSLTSNALLTGFRAGLSRFGLVRWGASRAMARQCIADHDVRCNGENALASSLSGGNLQKFIVGRELALKPDVLVVSQPTWGVDVNAAASIRQALLDLCERGAGVLIISEELEELFEVTDRLHVMCQGRLSPSVATRDADTSTLGQWMSGSFLPDAGTGTGTGTDSASASGAIP